MSEVVTSGGGRGEDGGIGVEAAMASPDTGRGDNPYHHDGISAQGKGNENDHRQSKALILQALTQKNRQTV